MEYKLKILTNTRQKSAALLHSLVDIRVIGKTEGFHKVLVDGRLYVTQLPLEVEIGEILIGSVVKKNPLVISLDSFFNYQTMNSPLLKKILLKLRIGIDRKSMDAVALIIKNNKALVKSKILLLIKALQTVEFNLTEGERSVLVKLIWYYDEATFTELFKLFRQSFDVSFNAIAGNIYRSWLHLRATVYNEGLLKALEKIIALNFDMQTGLEDLSPLKNKVDKFIDLYGMIEKIETDGLFKHTEYRNLKNNLMKYIFQKLIYQHASVYPEFTAVISNNKSSLFLFKYENMQDLSYNESYGINIRSENGGNLVGLLTGKSFYGELKNVFGNEELVKERVNNFNVNMLNTYGLSVNIKILDTTEEGSKNKIIKRNYETILAS